MVVVTILFWLCLAALAWTHVLYPIAARLGAAIRTRPVRRDDSLLPTVVVIVAAYDEESVIGPRIANLQALDYPTEKLEIVVTSDASTDRTEQLAAAAGAHVIQNSRGGKVAAQDRAVHNTAAEIVAFSDANCTWQPDALFTLAFFQYQNFWVKRLSVNGVRRGMIL